MWVTPRSIEPVTFLQRAVVSIPVLALFLGSSVAPLVGMVGGVPVADSLLHPLVRGLYAVGGLTFVEIGPTLLATGTSIWLISRCYRRAHERVPTSAWVFVASLAALSAFAARVLVHLAFGAP